MISDLIVYCCCYDNLIVECVQWVVCLVYGGDWMMWVFVDEILGVEYVVLIKGDLIDKQLVLVWMYVLDLLYDVLGIGCEDVGDLFVVMELIVVEGWGVVVLFCDVEIKLFVQGEVLLYMLW